MEEEPEGHHGWMSSYMEEEPEGHHGWMSSYMEEPEGHHGWMSSYMEEPEPGPHPGSGSGPESVSVSSTGSAGQSGCQNRVSRMALSQSAWRRRTAEASIFNLVTGSSADRLQPR